MSNILKIIAVFLAGIPFISYASIQKDDIIPSKDSDIVASQSEGLDLLDFILSYLRDTIFGLLFIIAVSFFVYTGARLIVARGNQEEFTRALKSLVYAGVGLFVVVFAWAAVRLVSTITL